MSPKSVKGNQSTAQMSGLISQANVTQRLASALRHMRGEKTVSTRIFCFTGTGNSLMIAKALASDLGNSDIAPIPCESGEILREGATRIGLVFPVYYGGLPLAVQRFLPSLRPFKNCYVFAVVTHAGGPGRALPQLRHELETIGLELSSGFRMRMPQNFTISYEAPSKEETAAAISEAKGKITEIAEVVRSLGTRRPDHVFPPYSGQSQRYQRFIEGVNKSDSHFRTDENCTGCGLCEKVCPVQNIVLDGGRPQWLHRCEQCLACMNWCPESAIQAGSQSSSMGRYTNPEVSLGEIVRKQKESVAARKKP
jgi:ferredoxin